VELIKIALLLIGGGVTLSYGAHFFVQSASRIAHWFGIPTLIIGLTIVAFGTSAPELAVNIMAVLKGNNDLAMGNVVGSNIFNLAFILGLCALIRPLTTSSQLIKIDFPILVIISFVLWWFNQDLFISKTESLLLILGLFLYTSLQLYLAFKNKNAHNEPVQVVEKSHPLKEGLIITLGLLALMIGAKFFVDGAVLGARLLGLSEAIIGLTIIAAGTSLPELATSAAATLKGEREIAIGNVIGSNLFNILGVIGFSGALSLHQLPVNKHMAQIDTMVMVGITLLCLPFLFFKAELNRLAGGLLFASWFIYTGYLIFYFA